MLYLILGAGLLALYFLGTGRKTPLMKRREWRVLTGAAALACFTAAVFVGVRGGWGSGIVLAVVGLGLAMSARKDAIGPAPTAAKLADKMSRSEACRILGVGPDAGREDIKAAYTRLMQAVHPDKGGTAGLAAQLNAARDRLLSKS